MPAYSPKERFRKLISQREKSGLTVAAFCKQHSVSQHQYYYWRVRINGPKEKQIAKAAPSFLPIAYRAPSREADVITITLPDSSSVSLPSRHYEAALPIILKTLSEKSCRCN